MGHKTDSTRLVAPAGGGIGFLGLLSITLIVLKILDKIQVSWLWITAPIWMPLALLTSLFAGGVVTMLLGAWFEGREAKREQRAKAKARAKLKSVK